MYIYEIYHVVLHADFIYFYVLCQKWRIKHVQSVVISFKTSIQITESILYKIRTEKISISVIIHLLRCPMNRGAFRYMGDYGIIKLSGALDMLPMKSRMNIVGLQTMRVYKYVTHDTLN